MRSCYVLVVKSRMRWVGHATRMGNMRNSYTVLIVNLKGGVHFGIVNVVGLIIVRRDLKIPSEVVLDLFR